MKKEGKNVGQIVKETRKAKGLTQMDLAELMGMSYQQIQKYEKGVDNISVERLKQLAKVLDVPVTLFFPSDKEMVAESPAVYGKMADDELLLLRLYRSIKDKKIKNAVLEFLKTMAAR
jgi:transcriptional regulator with XRE-family HTH domain